MNTEIQNQSTMADNLIHSLVIDGKSIMEMRLKDGFCNLTKLCKAGEKEVSNYLQNNSTKAYIEELSRSLGIPRLELIETKIGGNKPGSFCHPKIAIHCAQWISAKFALAVTDLVMEFMSGRITTEQSQNAFKTLQESVSPTDHEFRMRELELKEREYNVKDKELDIRKGELEIQSKQLGERLLITAEENMSGALTKQVLRDAAINLMNNGSQSRGEVHYDMPRILTEMGISLTQSSKLGRMVARMYRTEFEEPKKEEKLINGSMRAANVYPKSRIPTIKAWLQGI